MKDDPILKVALIAGSSGSLEPLKVILAALEPDIDAAILVLQHLDPSQPSQLPQMLVSATALPCDGIENGMALEAGRVYIARPGGAPLCEDGILRVIDNLAPEERIHSIDALAQSMAHDATIDPALILLSGIGHDGSRGAVEIRRRGGLVIAQSPDEAIVPSMPIALIDKNLASKTLLASEIAAAVIAFAAGPAKTRDQLPVKPAIRTKESDLQTVLELLRENLGQDFSSYRPATLQRRLERRLCIHDLLSIREYATRFRNDVGELQLLCEDFLIGVTSFFRDRPAFDTLGQEVLPSLLGDLNDGDEFRAWVIGCSSGEEVYSLAMLLCDIMSERGLKFAIKIFATDLDAAALDYARVGVYTDVDLRAVPPEYHERYFEQVDGKFIVHRHIREMVVFATHNVITDIPFSRLDLILCRNLLIYLKEQVKNALLRLFHYALRSGGVLFLGSSESIGNADRHFTPLSKKWRIYRLSEKAPRRKPQYPLFSKALDLRLTSSDSTAEPNLLLRNEGVMRRLIERNGPSQFLVDGDDQLLYTLGRASPYLQVPTGEPSENFLNMAQDALRTPLRALLNRTRQEGTAVASSIWLDGDNEGHLVVMSARAIREQGFNEFVLIVISPAEIGAKIDGDGDLSEHEHDKWTVDLLKKEVDATREDMQRTIKSSRTSDNVLRRANEEIMAMNEELQSSNEELEASKEEMQSLNDELANSNSALTLNLDEIENLNADLQNVLANSDSVTLIVDDAQRIKRYTPNITNLMRLKPTDIDREVGDIARLFDDPGLLSSISLTLDGAASPEHEILTEDGRWMLRRVLPYRDLQGTLSGAVINFIDVTAMRESVDRDTKSAALLEQHNQLLDIAAPVFGRDSEGKITYWNTAAEELWGFQQDEALGAQAHKLLRTVFPIAFENAQQTLLETGHWRGVVRQTTRRGRVIDLAATWTKTSEIVESRLAIAEVYQDLSVTMQLRSALHEEQELFHLLLDWTSNAEYWTDATGRITYITPAVEEITGYSTQAFMDDPKLLTSRVVDACRSDWDRHIAVAESPEQESWKTIPVQIHRRDGSLCWIEHRFRIVYSSNAQVLGYRGTIRDIDEVHRLESEALRLAYTDPLTELPNRRMLARKLEEACAMSERTGDYCALAMLDLDHFKRINDSEGHSIGDELLIKVGQRLKEQLRAFDTVTRIGGDEFILILNNLGTDRLQASLLASRICNKVREDLTTGFKLPSVSASHHVTCSLGIALFCGTSESPEMLMQQADMALYNAKDSGRNIVRHFNAEMQDDVDRRMATEKALIAARDAGDLVMYYQAQTDGTGRPTGLEALLRWRADDGQMVSPTVFMDSLEDQPLVAQIGRWTLENCMHQIKAWEDESEQAALPVGINVSAGYLLNESFCRDVEDLIEKTGIVPSSVVFELTENALLIDEQRTLLTLNRLTDLGFRISLDDFGTGYSSLSHLRSMPLAQLKIDQTFIAGLNEEPNCLSIVKTVIAMGDALGLDVVAEGVETEAQRDTLHELGCQHFQGYLFSRPAPADKVLRK